MDNKRQIAWVACGLCVLVVVLMTWLPRDAGETQIQVGALVEEKSTATVVADSGRRAVSDLDVTVANAPRFVVSGFRDNVADGRGADSRQVGNSKRVWVARDVVLARVNGRDITLADLVSRETYGESSGLMIDPAELAEMLDRAVRNEVVIGAAEERGIQLTAGQEERLHARWSRLEGNLNVPPVEWANNILWVHPVYGRSNIELVIHEAAVRELENNLVSAQGARVAHVTDEDVATYYAQHQEVYETFPDDPVERAGLWARISADARNAMGPIVRASSMEERERIIDELKLAADVEIIVP